MEENLGTITDFRGLIPEEKKLSFLLWKGLFIFWFATLITKKKPIKSLWDWKPTEVIFKEAIKDLEGCWKVKQASRWEVSDFQKAVLEIRSRLKLKK